ncbi:RNA polymerase factor sigma-54 [Calidifontibacillus oryziterrae]|uniref:RNA polymerase factor sigma-54 n=1 Tax=Calidifontibacillus oryziterrae TaxID=1191699 RepID=UPI000304B7DD|nr:RNA polymerase factor sigma-54 [Calidifontibacillus oryziterrae]
MRQELFQQQTTKLIMTTELRQAISLLQYSSIELVQFLQEQAIENPLLCVDSVNLEFDRIKKTTIHATERQIPIADDQSKMTIQDHLIRQIGLLNVSLQERKVMNYIILLIDEHGYFYGDIEEVSKKLNVTLPLVELALRKIQECEPIGVAARNLRECLLIQLQNRQPRNEFAELIVANYLQALADRKWKEISKKTGATVEEVQGAFDLIQSLNPRPGSRFSNTKPEYIIPDLIVSEEDGSLRITLNEHLIPKIKIEAEYKPYINMKEHDSHEYLQDKLNQVHFIKRAIEQRLNTMKKVMTAIVAEQEEFFYHDESKLKPLTMKEIADAIGVHESTVSRAVNGKYVQTPQGVFELKYFFSSSIQAPNQADTSSKSVKAAISKMIDEENKKKPLSDQQIASILKEQHSLQISRRTVAKYRDQLKILPSSKRKRF